MAPIPILVVGDSPNLSSGLGRITRDLCNRLHAEEASLGIDLAVLGLNWDALPQPWTVYPIKHFAEWADKDLPYAWAWHSRGKLGVIFTVWDPARCYPFTKSPLPAGSHRRWGYFAIDAENRSNSLSGMAAEAIRGYDRVLAYGRWGAGVLRPLCDEPISYLPHGLDLGVWSQPIPPIAKGEGITGFVGCVSTNQPRKNLALLFETWEILHRWDPGLRFWLHVDLLLNEHIYGSYDVRQLAEDFGLPTIEQAGPEALLHVTLPSDQLGDAGLAKLYAACDCTILPSLGEGFGYPIVESLAAGTPVVHGNYAGGADLVPTSLWRPTYYATRIDGPLNSVRPVYSAQAFAVCMQRGIEWKRKEPEVAAAYCRGSVANLDWEMLWPRWRAWFKQGLDEMRGNA